VQGEGIVLLHIVCKSPFFKFVTVIGSRFLHPRCEGLAERRTDTPTRQGSAEAPLDAAEMPGGLRSDHDGNIEDAQATMPVEVTEGAVVAEVGDEPEDGSVTCMSPRSTSQHLTLSCNVGFMLFSDCYNPYVVYLVCSLFFVTSRVRQITLVSSG
jgi:hypothetical protein